LSLHRFIFNSGLWIGEGKITLSSIDEKLPFYTRWKVDSIDKKTKNWSQEIQISGFSDKMVNQFSFFDISNKAFGVNLENQSLGKVSGKGIINDKIIGWEFRLSAMGFEGFEFYEISEAEDTYLVHAEYATNDDFRTVIHGKIWHSHTPK
tara:strand:+ start:736 stop:1185 length:450 start_codon:yes stop_codon:yes gene_type:complete